MSFLPCQSFRQETNNNARASQPTDLERIVYIDSVESVGGFTLIRGTRSVTSRLPNTSYSNSNRISGPNERCAVFVDLITRIGLPAA